MKYALVWMDSMETIHHVECTDETAPISLTMLATMLINAGTNKVVTVYKDFNLSKPFKEQIIVFTWMMKR